MNCKLEQHSDGEVLRGLSEFAQGWRRLQAGGLLLPDLVEFYRWLHTELCMLFAHIIICNHKPQSLQLSAIIYKAYISVVSV